MSLFSASEGQCEASQIHDRFAWDRDCAQSQRTISFFQTDFSKSQGLEFLHLRFAVSAWDCVLIGVKRRVPRGAHGRLKEVVLETQLYERTLITLSASVIQEDLIDARILDLHFPFNPVLDARPVYKI